MIIIGISAWYHDSAVAVIRDGKLICAAQEERFSRIKNDASFPARSLSWCCSFSGIVSPANVDYIVYYEKPMIKFERLIETWIRNSPKGAVQFANAMPMWVKKKLMARRSLEDNIRAALNWGKQPLPSLLFNDHHGSHAAASFFSSPFKSAAVLCLDGVGEWDTSTAWSGEENNLKQLWRIEFPHSLGLLYSAFTSFCGFRVNSGEYKLMGLAPYGEPVYSDLIESELIDVKGDGSFKLNMHYFDYQTGGRMTNRHFSRLFGGPPLALGAVPGRREMDMAASIQKVVERVVVKMADHLKQATGEDNLCLGGGVALNCVANSVLQRTGLFKGIWVPSAPGDAGSAQGAALSVWHEYLNRPRQIANEQKAASQAYLGPEWSDDSVAVLLRELGAVFDVVELESLVHRTAKLLAKGKVVGWFQGRMEFGPRALGGRSILGDPRNPDMVKRMNTKIKRRESFRPFAPSILKEYVHEWFDFPANNSHFMHSVASVLPCHLLAGEVKHGNLAVINEKRSVIPAVTHVDMSSRLHTVSKYSNCRFHDLISSFQKITGVPLLINTSFNVRGEPIVCSPEDAWRCFMSTDMDVLVVGRCILFKKQQVREGGENITGLGVGGI